MNKKNVFVFGFILFIVTSLTSCKYPDSYIYDLCKAEAPKEEIIATSEKHKNFYDMVVFKGEDGTDPLYAAVAKYKDKDLADFFISNGADVNTEYLYRGVTRGTISFTLSYATPLHLAIGLGNYDMVEFLLNNNADVNKATKMTMYNNGEYVYTMDYINPYQMALNCGYPEIASLIKSNESFKDAPCYFMMPGDFVKTCPTEILEQISKSVLAENVSGE